MKAVITVIGKDMVDILGVDVECPVDVEMTAGGITYQTPKKKFI